MSAPLKHLRIVDLTTVLMGPYTTQLLADMGAEVIKVEAPEGDATRGIGPALSEDMGPLYLQANRGKRSIALDLKTATGKAALLDIVARASVVVTSIRPAALERLGLGFEAFRAVNQTIVHAALTGYGSGGPYAERPAYDDLIQAAIGIPDLYQRAGGTELRYLPIAVADRFVGAFAVGAVLAALRQAETDKRAVHVEVPMFETMAQLVLGDHIGGLLFDPPAGPSGYQRLLSHNRRPYPTRDGHVAALIYTDRQWRAFLAGTGHGDRFDADPRFRNMSTRTANIDAIYEMVTDIFLGYTTAEAVEMLRGMDIPVMPINSIDALMDDEHLAAVGFFQDIDHPTEGKLRMPAPPLRFDGATERPAPAPKCGQDSEAILRELGYSDERIAEVLP